MPLLGAAQASFRRHGRRCRVVPQTGAHARSPGAAGTAPRPGLAGITRALANARTETRDRDDADNLAALASWWKKTADFLSPLEQAFGKKSITLEELIVRHLEVAELLAGNDGDVSPLWRDNDGEAAALLLNQLREAAGGLPEIEPGAYPVLFRALAMKSPVRPRLNRHRAITILGPLEARLQRFDRTILGGLNEGSWPQSTPPDPWFSRPMRRALGLEQPERGIGLAAHDFAMLAAGGDVLLTRAQKAEGAPTIASRWLQRLMQLTRGLEMKIPEGPWAERASLLTHVAPVPPITPPLPRPPVSARPRKLSVTEIETWLRDPYAIYARHILGLRPLDPLDMPIGPLERGTAVHRALELYKRRFEGAPPKDAVAQLMAIADKVFEALAIPKAALSIWRPRFEKAARWFVDFERGRASQIARSVLEIRGQKQFKAPGGIFTLSGVADRIDILKNGKAAILDYKTGRPPSNPQVRELITPQLPLEGAILAAGGFSDLGNAKLKSFFI